MTNLYKTVLCGCLLAAVTACSGTKAGQSADGSGIEQQKAEVAPEEAFKKLLESHNKSVADINKMGTPSASWSFKKLKEFRALIDSVEATEAELQSYQAKFEGKMVQDNSNQIIFAKILVSETNTEKNAKLIKNNPVYAYSFGMGTASLAQSEFKKRIAGLQSMMDAVLTKDEEGAQYTSEELQSVMSLDDLEMFQEVAKTLETAYQRLNDLQTMRRDLALILKEHSDKGTKANFEKMAVDIEAEMDASTIDAQLAGDKYHIFQTAHTLQATGTDTYTEENDKALTEALEGDVDHFMAVAEFKNNQMVELLKAKDSNDFESLKTYEELTAE